MARAEQKQGGDRLYLFQGNTNGKPTRLHLLNKLIDRNKKEGKKSLYLFNDIRTSDMRDMRFKDMSTILVKDSALVMDKDTFAQEYKAITPECLIAKVQAGIIPLLVSTIYNRPGNVISESQIAQITHIAQEENLPLFLMGDFNSQHTALGGNLDSPAGKELVDLISKYNLIPIHNEEKTYLCAGEGRDNILDLCLTNRKGLEIAEKLIVADHFGSDHLPLQLEISIQKERKENTKTTITTIDYEGFGETLEQLIDPTKLTELKTREEIDKSIEEMTSTIQDAKAMHTIQLKVRTSNDIPIDKETNSLITERRKLVRKRKKDIETENETKARINFLNREIKRRLAKLDGNKKLQQIDKMLKDNHQSDVFLVC